jgi:hypothetical protein
MLEDGSIPLPAISIPATIIGMFTLKDMSIHPKVETLTDIIIVDLLPKLSEKAENIAYPIKAPKYVQLIIISNKY